jgi:hypothetical protein
MARRALAALTSLTPALLLGQQEGLRPVTIKVSDPTGVGVAHANIRLVPIPAPVSARLETDERGTLSLNLKPGEYGMFVVVPGFKTARMHLDIAPPGEDVNAVQQVAVTLQIGATGGSNFTPVCPKDSLVLSAEPYHSPVILTPGEVHVLPHVTVKVHNGHTDAEETYSGVPLVALLAKVNAPVGSELRKEAFTDFVIATGTDGYSVLLSLPEIDPTFHAGQVIVADTRDGQPLASSGPFQLIVTDDKRPARWVRNLISIVLVSAP